MVTWWQEAVFYQIYPRSFADSNGDGIGDIAGVTAHLDDLVQLGVDALWLSPFFRSPQVDHGYDVSDYCDVDPMFGTLADFDELLAEAHARGLRLTVDMVPNHCSDQHEWFRQALAAGPNTPERRRFLFREGSGANGENPPTDVISIFGGPAWTRVMESDGQPGQWYFHFVAPEQPDFNWHNPEVGDEFERVLRFWLDRGVDGFRVDVGDALIKHPEQRSDDPEIPLIIKDARSELHAIYRRWRSILDSYDGDRMMVLEMGGERELLTLLVRPDEAHLYFNFPFMHAREWADVGPLRSAVDHALWMRGATGTPPTWVTDNHDTPRSVTRFGSSRQLVGDYVPSAAPAGDTDDVVDIELGRQRARAMALALLSLPGAVYLYNGQELGLPNVDDLPEAALQDPVWERSGHTDRGRDGCRIPMPWSDSRPPYGFASKGVLPWLPQPVDWAPLTWSAQLSQDDSFLNFYRKLLELRKEHPALRSGQLSWLPAPDHVLAYERMVDPRKHPGAEVIEVWVNLAAPEFPMPAGVVLSASGPVGATLPPNTAVWLQTR